LPCVSHASPTIVVSSRIGVGPRRAEKPETALAKPNAERIEVYERRVGQCAMNVVGLLFAPHYRLCVSGYNNNFRCEDVGSYRSTTRPRAGFRSSYDRAPTAIRRGGTEILVFIYRRSRVYCVYDIYDVRTPHATPRRRAGAGKAQEREAKAQGHGAGLRFRR
jgi:hypothetical protein